MKEFKKLENCGLRALKDDSANIFLKQRSDLLKSNMYQESR